MPIVSSGQITIVDVNDGVTAQLSADSFQLAATATGTVSSYLGAETTLKITEAGIDTSSTWTIYVSATGGGISYRDSNDSVDRTGTGSTNGLINGETGYVRVVLLTSDLSWLDISAEKNGVVLTKRFSVVKSKQGATGTRGTITTARAISGTTWSDTEAAAAITAQNGGSPITGDVVTLYNSTSTPPFSETRIRSSSNTWEVLAAFFGGNVLVDGTLGANKLVAGTITSGYIAAKAISTDKLIVTGRGPALNADPSIQDLTAWTALSGSYTRATGLTDLPYGGQYALQNTTLLSGRPASSELIPLESGKNYRMEAYFRVASGTPGAGNFFFIAWYDQAETFLQSNVAQPTGAGSPAGWVSNGTYSYAFNNFTPSTSWELKTFSFGPNQTAKIPSNARYVRIGAILNNSGLSQVVQVGGIRLMEKANADLIVPGAITAEKLAAEAIAVGSAAIANGAITNAMIGDVSATKITAGYTQSIALESSKFLGSEFYIGGTPTYTFIDHDNQPSTPEIKSGIQSVSNPNISLTSTGAEFAVDYFKIKNGASGAAATVFEVVNNEVNIKSAFIGTGTITNAMIANVIQSTNYSAGTTGWKIDKAGEMEMNNATFRGTLDVKSAASGARVEMTSSKIRVYDADGNLRVKIGDLA